MPPVTAVITASLVSAGVGAATAGFIASAIVGTITSTVFSFITGALAGKPDSPSNSFASIRTRGATQQFRQPIAERDVVYGEVRKSGAIVYAGVTENNKYLHLVITLATHEIEEIGEVFINDVSVAPDQLDGSGVVNTGRYDGLVRIKKHLGTANQTADADLVSDVPEWTTNHRLRGIAYMYVRCEWDRDVFTSGIPNFSAWVKGKKCIDTRDASSPQVEAWTPNIALQSRDYLTNTYYGLSAQNIDDDELSGAANTCDEFVTTENLDVSFIEVDTTNNIITMDGDRLQFQLGDRVQITSGTVGGLSGATNYYVIPYQRKDTPRIKLATSLENAISGTEIDLTSGTTGNLRKNAEPRYHGGGVLKMSAARGENLTDVVSGMSGNAVYAGGKWRLLAGEYQSPTIYFDEGDLVSGIEVTTKVSERERFNRAQGVFISPLNDGNPTDYPLVKNDTYATEDGKVIKKNIDLPFTQRPHTAQRIAKLQLERMRQEIVFRARFKLTAFKVQVGDNFYFSFDRYGWTNKVFEVISWGLSTEEGSPVIDIVARENASAVYDWNSGEETAFDPAPNTSLPSPFDVDPPTSLVVTPIEISTQQADKVYEFEVSWTPPTDFYVTNGGWYEVQFKKTTDSVWRRSYRAEDIDTEIRIPQVEPQVNYDVRIRSVNYLRVRSQYVTLSGFTVSSPSGATVQKDYLVFQGNGSTITDSLDYGLFSEAVDNNLDYGDFV